MHPGHPKRRTLAFVELLEIRDPCLGLPITRTTVVLGGGFPVFGNSLTVVRIEPID